jgi:cytochrome c peroxidase
VIPQFHALAARAPYFSNGSLPTLEALVGFYEERLGIRFSDAEKRDLVSYLSSL